MSEKQLANDLAAGRHVTLTRPIRCVALREESKSRRLIGFDTDPGKKMANFQNTAIQTALKRKEKSTAETQTSWQLMEEMTHPCGLPFLPKQLGVSTPKVTNSQTNQI